MADFVSPIVDIISRLWPYCARHTRYLCKLQENKILLRNAIKELKEVRDDVQRRVVDAEADPNEPKKRTDLVSGWFQRVEIIESEVEEMLQKVVDEQQQQQQLGGGYCCCPSPPPSNKCWSNYKLGKSIAKKIPLVYELKEKAGHFEEDQLTYRLPPSSVQDMNLESTVGMEFMFDKVWKHITSSKDDNKGSIIGLYGHGGVGKTTLLKKINNEFHNKISTGSEHGFDDDDDDYVVIFVVVSKPINYEAIQKKIGDKLGLLLKGDEDESSRADKIFNQLKKKKNFVILLDDIWERVDLQRIGISSSSSSSSKVVVVFTTRSKQVCGLMEATYKFKVECLPWDKAWSLFQEKVGEEALNGFPRARELAKDVAKQCGGLPLALITIGRAMSTTKSEEEWEDAITTLRNSASEFQGMGDEVLPRLKLSYDNLRNETMKSCFLYCALYPEDYNISKSEIIDYWIAEGFLINRKLDEARTHGHHVIETLKRACLLEESGLEIIFPGKTYVKMHDIIRDLALWIVNDCKSTTGKFLVASNSNVCEKWRNAERISWWWTNDGGINNDGSEEPPPRSPNLQTLMVKGKFSLPQTFFQFMPNLRVLDLSNTRLTELPTSICELHELQYLNLGGTKIKELPFEMRKLIKLKFLDLSDTEDLSKIPPGVIANLSELQVLKLADSGFKGWGLKEEEDGGLSLCELDRLKQLQDVQLTISTSLAMEELLCNQKLPRICTRLVLENCVNLKLLPPSSTTSKGYGNLTSLKELCISGCVELEELILFSSTTNTTTTTTTTSAAGLLISNNNKLEQLYLSSLLRLKNIVWGEKYYKIPFQNLDQITILNCDALKELTWLVYVENLKTLVVGGCKGLETIIELGDGGLEGVFGRLEKLVMYNLPRLKSICRNALALPSIKTIRVSKCPELKKLPLDNGSNVNNTLQRINGETEWWNQLEWEDETIKSKFLPYLNK